MPSSSRHIRRRIMDIFPSILAILWIYSMSISGIYTQDVEDYCMFETFQPGCQPDEVIIIDQAHYGRMRVGRCIEAGMGRIGCKNDVLDIVEGKCSGRRQCVIEVASRELAARGACGKTLQYLAISYHCVKVVSTQQHEQCEMGDVLKITSPSLNSIASVTTRESGCGGDMSPWLVEAPSGQNIILKLLDFAPASTSNPLSSVCLMYATVKEPSSDRQTTICGAQDSERIVYRSVGSSLEISIVSRGEDRHFLLEYQFVGCSDMVPVEGYTFTRVLNRTTVECDSNGEQSIYTCNGTAWKGQMPNCTALAPLEPEEKMAEEISKVADVEVYANVDDTSMQHEEADVEVVQFNFSSISWGMVLILVGILTMGMVACVLIISVVYLKRKSHEAKPPIIMPGPPSDTGYEDCDFAISKRTSTIYRDGYRTVPKMYTAIRNEGTPAYDDSVWGRPLPPEPIVAPHNV